MDPINIQINYVPSRELIDISTETEGVIHITEKEWPFVIDEICDHLRDFLKEMKIQDGQ